MQSNTYTRFAILALGFIVLVVGGRYLLTSNQTSVNQNSDVRPEVSQSSPPAEIQSIAASPQAQDQSISTCIAALKKEITTSKKAYEKGTMLVTFKEDVAYTEAKEALATYGVTVKSTATAEASFSTRHLVTGTFTPGDEFSKICLVRMDDRVKYAGINPTFNLHE
jgi:hypothetical protein